MNQKKPYWQKLQDPRWQKMRLQVFDRDGFVCRTCGSEVKRLEVHHLYYISGREPWEYPLGAFKTLCFTCHEESKIFHHGCFDVWEHFQELVNCYGVEVGDEYAECWFIPVLMGFAQQIGDSPTEILSAFEKGIQNGLITKDLLSTWRSSEILLAKEVQNVS